MLFDIIKKNRSYRRFYENHKIEYKILKELVELARLSPSARNLQPLKFYLSCTKDINEKIFPTLGWAGYLKNWDGPKEGERPSAYIIILADISISKNVKWDDGIAAQSILLGAVEKELGGCMIGSVKRDELKSKLNIPGYFEILLVIALGKPKEKVVIDTISENGSIYYWRDKEQVHHVPKRKLDELIVRF
ncbi:MAG: nitroreductase family protein [Bacteroidales bacterium]|nr:nitroreductase family protein [Bacteroidales bacterium]